MADMRKFAGGGPEMLRESMEDYAAAGVPSQRLIPTPDEARRAQEAANRYPRIMPEREATIRAQEALAASMYGQAHGVAEMIGAPGKMFSRSDILAIIKGEKARASRLTSLEQQMVTRHTCDALVAIFENLE